MVNKGGKVVAEYTLDEALDEYFTDDLADNIYTEANTEEYITWVYSGACPESVEMYHLVGGQRLPCLSADGNVEIGARKLEVPDDEERASRPDVCTMH